MINCAQLPNVMSTSLRYNAMNAAKKWKAAAAMPVKHIPARGCMTGRVIM